MSETDSEFLAWARDRYGSLTGPERDRLFALATKAGFALEAENERLRAMVVEAARLAAENERLRAALRGLLGIEDGPGMAVIGWSDAMDRARAALQDKSDD